jgi:hypothetical protein
MTSPERYAGRPLLRLVECYVLDAIGELGDQQARQLADMTPRLRELYSTDGGWQQIIATQLAFPPDAAGHLRQMWARADPRARADPLRWAQSVSDQLIS